MKKLFLLYFFSFSILTLTAQKSTDSTPSKKKTPNIKSALAFKESMEMKNMEHSFINMNEYLSSKIVGKVDQPFIFPRKKNCTLPEEFVANVFAFNTTKFIDSSAIQGLLFIQNGTVQYEKYWNGQTESVKQISWFISKSYISA
jgi:hypothetical protein